MRPKCRYVRGSHSLIKSQRAMFLMAAPWQAEKRMHRLKTRKVKESAEMREEMNLKAELDADTVSSEKQPEIVLFIL
jgi:hypothetical protein